MIRRAGLAILLLGLTATALAAHEVRPAYLELSEQEPGVFQMTWKQPVQGNRRLRIEPLLPPACATVGELPAIAAAGALVERRTVDCGPSGLDGAAVGVLGLEATLADALVRIRFANGDTVSRLLKPARPTFVVERAVSATVPTYLRLGVEHLLLGFDHILFVIGLMLLVRQPLQLVKVITAFTAAHSITLALSALGVVRLSQASVEAVIALTILYLAVELATPVAERRGPTARMPWTIAFGFGLLHGFGFAGALAEIGLPKNAALPALFLFNVGVELGQLLIVGGILAALWLLHRAGLRLASWAEAVPVALIGTLSAYWFLERTASLL